MRKARGVAVVVLLSLMSLRAFPLGVVNGSFEADSWGPLYTFDLGGNGGPVTGWNVIDPQQDGGSPWGIRNPTYGLTPYGDQYFVFYYQGGSDIAVEQTVTGLAPGETYALGFALASHNNVVPARVKLSFPAGSSTPFMDFTAPLSSGDGSVPMDTWGTFSYDFIPSASSVTFRFTGYTFPGLLSQGSAALDGVSISSVPEPVDGTFLLAGVLLSFAILRRLQNVQGC